MEQVVIILHNGALAQYSYIQKQTDIYILWLQQYKGYSGSEPPLMLILHREGRRWYSDGYPQALVEDLGYAINDQIRS